MKNSQENLSPDIRARERAMRSSPLTKTHPRSKIAKQSTKLLSLMLLSGIASCVIGYLTINYQILSSLLESPAMASPKAPGSLASSAIANQNFISQVVDKVGPAVVRIDASTSVPGNEAEDPFYRRFFGGQLPNQTQPEEQQSMGAN